MSIVSCQLDRVRGQYRLSSDGAILPDSIQNLRSADRTTTPNKSSNPVAGRIRNQRRDLMLHGVGATGFEPVISRIRSTRSFLNYCTLVEERGAARRCNAQTARTDKTFLIAKPMRKVLSVSIVVEFAPFSAICLVFGAGVMLICVRLPFHGPIEVTDFGRGGGQGADVMAPFHSDSSHDFKADSTAFFPSR
jgi:hypothetical protein